MEETYEEMKKRLFVEFGIDKNKKREEAWRLAMEYGHAHGMEEVRNYLLDLADLIK